MGRSSNRNQGRGGRGRGNKQTSNKNTKSKKKIEDYCFYVGSSKQASDFETTNEFILNYIKKTYSRGNDISEALRKLEEPNTDNWKPTLVMSKNNDDNEKERESRQYELEYKAEYDDYMKRKRDYNDNCFKAYALLWE